MTRGIDQRHKKLRGFPTFVLAVMLLLGGGSSPAQLDRSQPRVDTPPPDLPEINQRLAKEANAERQAALKRDTERLLQLATELKRQVDRSNENVLSLDVMKKAEQIEKLAKSVREKMRGNP